MKDQILLLLLFISLTLNAQFAPLQNINRCELCGIAGVKMVDLNQDGLLDVVGAGRKHGTVAWYENLGEGNFSEQRLLLRFESNWELAVIDIADFNNDGALDIIIGGEREDGAIEIYFNDGKQNFTLSQTLSGQRRYLELLFTEDVDQDGDIDFIIAEPNLRWHENDGTGQFMNTHEISSRGFVRKNELHMVDLDQDNDVDFVSDSEEWYKNDGLGNFIELPISDSIGGRAIAFADFNNDNTLDIVRSHVSGIYSLGSILVSTRGADNSFTHTSYESRVTTGKIHQIKAADFDMDGNIDVLWVARYSWSTSNNGMIAWQRNEGEGQFRETQNIDFTIISDRDELILKDMDQDGDIDIFHAKGYRDSGQLSWYENDGKGNFQKPKSIGKPQIYSPSKVFPCDIDADGDVDLLASSIQGVAWLENDGTGNFADKQEIGQSVRNVIGTADLDNNGYQDIISGYRGELYWYRNIGKNCFSPAQYIAEDRVTSMQISDIDNDGDKDLVAMCGRKLNYYDNLGQGKSWRISTISNGDYGRDFFLTDFNNDGLEDIVYTNSSEELAYHINRGGGKFRLNILTFPDLEEAESITVGDLDNDGDLDLFYGSAFTGFGWFENSGTSLFNKHHKLDVPPKLEDNDLFHGMKLVSIDIDGDKDLDIMAYLRDSLGRTPTKWHYTNYWLENDGSGNFTERKFADLEYQIYYTDAHKIDLDNDKDLDFLFVNHDDSQIAWYENLQIDEPKIPQEKPEPKLKATLYPNPFNDFLHFDIEDLEGIESFNFVLYNSVGRPVFGERISRQCTFVTGDLLKGIYFYRIETVDGQLIKKGSLLHVE